MIKYVRGNSMSINIQAYQQEGRVKRNINPSTYDDVSVNILSSFIKVMPTEFVVEADRLIVTLPSSLGVGKYSIEVILSKTGVKRRAFVKDAFAVVQSCADADFNVDTIDGGGAGDIGLTYHFMQIVDQ